MKIVLVEGTPVTEDAAANLARAQALAIEVLNSTEDEEKIAFLLQNVDVLVDAMYGTGFHGALRENAKKAAKSMNTAIAAVFALDVPSGINADNGELDENAVHADFTIAFDSLKPAHFLYPALEQCGMIECAEIGIDSACRLSVEQTFTHISEDAVFESIPYRAVDSNKGTFGRLLNVSSSLGMAGAGRLSTMGAQRVGTGLVVLAAPQSVIPTHAATLIEAVLLPLQETELGCASPACIPQLAEKLEQASAVLVGCGLGNNADTAQVVEWLLRNSRVPLVIDADGINTLCGNINVLSEAVAPVVLTPHPAEMARLLGVATKELLQHKVALAGKFAVQYQVVLVLKGAHTLVCLPNGEILINTTGNNGLAKAGSGDVLAGMLAGFLAQGLSARDAAMCGVFLHGRAGDRCARRLSQTAMQPSELLTDLCALFLEHGR